MGGQSNEYLRPELGDIIDSDDRIGYEPDSDDRAEEKSHDMSAKSLDSKKEHHNRHSNSINSTPAKKVWLRLCNVLLWGWRENCFDMECDNTTDELTSKDSHTLVLQTMTGFWVIQVWEDWLWITLWHRATWHWCLHTHWQSRLMASVHLHIQEAIACSFCFSSLMIAGGGTGLQRAGCFDCNPCLIVKYEVCHAWVWRAGTYHRP